METIQAHMYTYLNQKYGLKPITVQWAMSIVNGIRKYGHDDAEVAAFGKLLRNELEEEQIENLKKLKGNIRVAIHKFKGEDPKSFSIHEGEQILLISGYKRDEIDVIMSRLPENKITVGTLTPSQLEQLALNYTLRQHC